MTGKVGPVAGYRDATALLAALRGGAITSASLVEQLLAACDAGRDLRAVSQIDADSARKAARDADRRRAAGEDLPLLGLPVCVKDNIDVADFATTAGTPALAKNIARQNAPVVQRLLDQGAFVFCKTGMHELAYGTSGENAWQGTVRNPFDQDRIAGGSSSGSAAVVAAGMAPLSLGSDTGGSVRIPASFCGLAGLRPTAGRYPNDGVFPISPTRDTVGPIARSVSDLLLLDQAICPVETPAPPIAAADIRLGVPDAYFFDGLDPSVAATTEQALDALRQAGVILVPVPGAEFGRLYRNAGFAVTLYETRSAMEASLARYETPVAYDALVAGIASPDVRAIMEDIGRRNPAEFAAAYERAISRERPALQALYAETLAAHRLDGIVFPASKLPPTRIGEPAATAEGVTPAFEVMIENTGPGSLSGVPGVTVPCGYDKSGAPLGLAVDGAFWSDRHLMQVGAALEALLPNPWRAM